jgi:exodeoxyribonuclease III
VHIATFNINNIRRRLPNLLRWIETSSPNVVCLQELKCTDAEFPIDAIRKAGYHAVWKGERSWNGVAILARGREPVMIRETLPGDAKDVQSRYIEAAVEGIVIGSIYLPNGNPQPGPKFRYKLEWFDRLIDHAGDLLSQDVPVILAGDYNVVPTDFDIYATRSFKDNALLQPEPRAAYAKLLADGWTDALRTLHPEHPMYTFWSYLRNRWPRDAGLRLDHLLLSPALAPRLKAAGVDRDVRGLADASDHAPAWIELKAGRRAAKKKPRRSGRVRSNSSEDLK